MSETSIATIKLIDRLDEFESHVQKSLSGNEIAEIMNLKMYQIEKLRTYLMDKRKIYIPLESSGGRGVLKASNSGISIARGRIEALGLGEMYPKHKKLQLKADNGKIVIIPIDDISDTASSSARIAVADTAAGAITNTATSQESSVTAITNPEQGGNRYSTEAAMQ